LLLGTEGDGLTSRWLHEADEAVRIPMHPAARSAGVDSLNVVAAAAIACHLLAGLGTPPGWTADPGSRSGRWRVAVPEWDKCGTSSSGRARSAEP